MPKYKFDDLVFNISEKRAPIAGDEELYIGLEHLDSGSLRVIRWGSKVALKGDKLIMREGDILFGRRNTYLRRVAIAPHDGLFSAHGMIFRAKNDVIDIDFLPFFIASDAFMNEAIRISVGSLSPTVNWKELRELEFDIPTLESQRKLTQLLIAANDLKVFYEELLQKTDELVKSQFIEMFGTVFKAKYPVNKLVNYAHIKHGYAFKGEYFTDTDNGILLVTPGNFNIGGGFQYKKCKYFTGEYSKDYVLQPGELIVTMTDLSKESDTLGNAAIVPNDGYVYLHNQRIGLFDQLDEGIDKIYLEFFMRTDDYRNHILSGAAGSTVKHTSPTKILEAAFILPPINKQREFSTLKQQSDKSKLVVYHRYQLCKLFAMNHNFGRRNYVY